MLGSILRFSTVLLALHSTSTAVKWSEYCEAIKSEEHSTFLPERLHHLHGNSGHRLEDDVTEFYELPLLAESPTLDIIEEQLTAAERAKRCDASQLRAPLFSALLPVAPTCRQICHRCFPHSAALCVQRRPKWDLMRTCLCTYDTKSPIAGAVFSFRHDKRVERLLRG
ncbi:unnamed protein product, partial [Mesorhabditis spiculigera]